MFCRLQPLKSSDRHSTILIFPSIDSITSKNVSWQGNSFKRYPPLTPLIEMIIPDLVSFCKILERYSPGNDRSLAMPDLLLIVPSGWDEKYAIIRIA